MKVFGTVAELTQAIEQEVETSREKKPQGATGLAANKNWLFDEGLPCFNPKTLAQNSRTSVGFGLKRCAFEQS